MANLHIDLSLHSTEELFSLQNERIRAIKECIYEADKVFIYQGEINKINLELWKRFLEEYPEYKEVIKKLPKD